MQRTRIKVCGLTSRRDANAAVAAGADAVGVVLAESPRQVTIDQAEDVFSDVPPFVARVGVFVDAPEEFVDSAVRRLRLTAVQFHGEESPGRCGAAPVAVVKAFRVGTEFDVAALEPFRGFASAVLLDTYDQHVRGGTGKAFPWQDLAQVPGWAPLVLAGGLNPLNVADAIRALSPYAVDVSSGVEERPGHKELEKMVAFVAAVRAADEVVSR